MTPTQMKVFTAILKALDGERKTLKVTDLVPFLPNTRRPNIAQTISTLCNKNYLRRLNKSRTTLYFELALNDKQLLEIQVKSNNTIQSELIKQRTEHKRVKRITREELKKLYNGRRYEDHDFKAKPEILERYIPSRGGHEIFSTSAASLCMEA